MQAVTWCFLLLAVVYAANAVPLVDEYDSSTFTYPRFINFPDGDGNMHLVDLEEPAEEELLKDATRNPADSNRYFLFTRRNPNEEQELLLNNVNSVLSSNFNPSRPTVVVVHGWLSHMDTNLNPVIRDAYLASKDCNVIIFDWRQYAIGGYVTAVRRIPNIGNGLGEFLVFLTSLGARFEDMHLVGFSLGAHVVGNAGRFTGGKVARVTGLDPAGPLWNLNSDRLSSTDAVYVEAIHTDGGYTLGGLGIGSPIADADFFLNGGVSQPGCLTNICNHNRAWAFFASSITYEHLYGYNCRNNLQISLNTCRGVTLKLGTADLRKSGSGKFRANTARRYPF